MSFSGSRSKFHKLVKFLYKLGVFIGVLPFSIDCNVHSVAKRSRVLQLYSILITTSMIIFLTVFHVKSFMDLMDEISDDENGRDILIIVSALEFTGQLIVLVATAMCLVFSGQTIIDLVNEGLKIEHNLSNSKFYNVKKLSMIIVKVGLKDVIYSLGSFGFFILRDEKHGAFLYYYELISTPVYCIVLGYCMNLKAISFYYASYLLSTFNTELISLLEKHNLTSTLQKIKKLARSYERLLTFIESCYELLKINSTVTILSSFAMLTGEVGD